MPVHAASITVAKPVANGAVSHGIECYCTLHNRLLSQMMLSEQHPYCIHRTSHASKYRRHCSSRVWSTSRVDTLPSIFSAGRCLYRSWMVHQCWCSTSTVDAFSFLILASYFSRVSCVCTPSSFSPRLAKAVCFFAFVFPLLGRAQNLKQEAKSSAQAAQARTKALATTAATNALKTR